MNCEIEFLPVGEASRAGDAIVVRYGTENDYELMLVDGGTADTGDKIVAHMKKHFPGRGFDHVLLTHSDQDHASGLRIVVEEMHVGKIWLHVPWELSREIVASFDGNWTAAALEDEIRANYDIISEIVDKAEAKSIDVEYPFAGCRVGPFTVLSPSRDCYLTLLPKFDKTPEPATAVKGTLAYALEALSRVQRGFGKLAAKAAALIPESWDVETLRDGGVTSSSNESSAVLYASTESGYKLLTGDAGIGALTQACDYADAVGLPLQNFSFVQIPHHGSRRNVGFTILDRLIGPRVARGTRSGLHAFVSTPVDDEVHPRKVVLNAFTRRGAAVYATHGRSIAHYGGFIPRAGYSSLTAMTLSPFVEEYD